MRKTFTSVKPIVRVSILLTTMISAAGSAHAQQAATLEISVKGHHFQPPEIRAPANRPIILRVKNLDTTAMEFESVSLRVEKVVAPGTQGVVNIRPLTPGQYEFFDDFHQETRGTLVVQ